jgi:myo-inositol-1(or 4)-monophosphatase
MSPRALTPESARDAARMAAAAAAALARGFAPDALNIQHKRAHDLVTAADLACQALIQARLREAFPDVGFLGEEGVDLPGDGSRWIVDPIDGTTNFAHGNPHCAVSIAWEQGGVVRAGVVHDIFRDEAFHAAIGGGAWLGDRPLRVTDHAPLDQCLVATGFPTGDRRRTFDLGPLDRVLREVRCVRRGGAAALDLAWVAAGRLDAYWESGLAPWDCAAGALLVREAGGRVTDLEGAPHHLRAPWVVATNGAVHDDLRRLVIGAPPTA